ncbi:hypothetical protein OJF2_03780 [Aquisphaera giovannonii]|uniref:Beta-hexosaminidase bacterial type N-terminal domain-containing protein n=1 Tax=Aquisphaera giovannonii TaxID=406548 RepID=A0A5B9VVM8_9BACT|nr:DUF4838 domain-containing protein [Aquisphaera giovannonii]QEH31911.1 hypothetical protein OJF2_03780 [Aquisphaera giovannonii]
MRRNFTPVRAAIGLVALAWIPAIAPTPARAGVTPATLATWPIVVPTKASPAERHAAEEFREFASKVAGAKSPMEIISTDAPPAHAILLGKAASLKTDDLGEEGYRIRVDDGRVEIAGGGPRGTLYGVYAFLEDDLGVRFLWHDATFVPADRATRAIAAGERAFRPRFAWRYSYFGVINAHPAFAARMRNNATTSAPELGGNSPWTLISHSVPEWVPVATLGKEHPEYFSLVDGKRRAFMKEDNAEDGGTQPCFSNPEVKRRIIDGVLAKIKREGKASGNVSISQNDNTQYCRCDACRAIDEREDSHMGALLTLLNEAADAVAKEHPGVFVGTLAYQFSRKPPKHLRPRPNVAIQLCSIEACQLHPLDDPECPLNVAFCKDLEGWCRITPNVYVWNYNTNFASYNSPCPNLDVIGPNVKYLAAHGVKGVFMQAPGNAQNTELCELRNDLISRMLWDPSHDDRRIRETFIDAFYGRAAGKVKEYLALIQDAARKSGVHQGCFGPAASYGITADVARKGLAILQQAMADAENPTIRDRVEKMTISPRTVLLDDLARWIQHHGGATTQPPADLIGRTRDDFRELLRLYDRHGVDRFSEGISTDQIRGIH